MQYVAASAATGGWVGRGYDNKSDVTNIHSCLGAFTVENCCQVTLWPMMIITLIIISKITTFTPTTKPYQGKIDEFGIKIFIKMDVFRTYPVCGGCYKDWHL